jgi:hypothetical protein
MVDRLRIQDGNPNWLSNSIVPSKDTVVSPSSSPQLATIQVNSNNVFTYVKVENPGTVDLGDCSCNTIGPWITPVTFQGFVDDPMAQISDTQFGFTFTTSPTTDAIGIPGAPPILALTAPPSGRRAWAWSPDGRFFAYVSSQDNIIWVVGIVALQNITRPDGTTLTPGLFETFSGQYGGPNPLQTWTNGNFAWAGSKAIVAKGPTSQAVAAFDMKITCSYAGTPFGWGWYFSAYGGNVDWNYLVSPCGLAVAIVPNLLNPIGGLLPPTFSLFTTDNAKEIPFRKNNGPLTIAANGAAPAITTMDHTASGVTINTGNGATGTVDDPECTFDGGGVIVRVDRVKASTLPTANLGVLPIGTAALGMLRQNTFSWVQVPNQNGWANESEKHWCLLAQAYTSLAAPTIPRPWNGQATNPLPFPVDNENCAQRNIEINP